MSEGTNGVRCVALVGPYLSGKTTLLESLLHVSGAIHRRGSVTEGNTVSNFSPEARARQMSVEATASHAEYLGDAWRFIDCPGSVEFYQDSLNALACADAAVVVSEPEIDRAVTLAPLLKHLEDSGIPHVLFINKMDEANNSVSEVMAALQQVSNLPLVLRQVPIKEGEGVTGYVDLVSERAYHYNTDAVSDLIPVPEEMSDTAAEARNEMLESLADFNDDLLERLLEEEIPDTEDIYANLTSDLQGNLIVPVVLGAAANENGVKRLLKLLRHEVPGVSATLERKGLDADGEAVAQVFKTSHVPHAGKLSLARIWRGSIKDGEQLNGERVSGLFRLQGEEREKLATAGAGEVVAFGRMEEVKTGDVLTPSGEAPQIDGWPEPLTPVYAFAVGTENKADEVKLSGALTKLTEEDPSLVVTHNQDTHQMLLEGQGEMHLQVAFDRLESKFNLKATKAKPEVPYKETIRKPTSVHGRFKRQTGGHGQFGDVQIDIRPQPRGAGFTFEDKIFGGHIPKQYIPAVEAGIREYMTRGPLGFPVVDFAVTLTDGSYHAVDSSEQAFKQAARIAMTEGMPKCDPVLLEPIYEVKIDVPSEFTNKVHSLVSGRRGQLLGFDTLEGWKGWDQVVAHMPQSEIGDLIIELRSLTLGVGNFHAIFDHMTELMGNEAEKIVRDRQGEAAAAQ
ncbi:MAG: elongation factor G [Alphaproteobacteria bacterium]|nr:elongation factor G [Alphaproteobacteria bacterium]